MNPITMVLADDHHLVRQGLRLLLETRLNCRILGEAATGTQAIDLVLQERPDLLIVDLSLPERNGIEVTETVHRLAPETRVIVLSMHSDTPHVQAALRAGAMAYVLKEALAEDFLQAITQVLANHRYLSPRLAEQVITDLVTQSPDAPPSVDTLSPREREVLTYVVSGMTSAAIAAELGIGVRTVEWHRANIMQKLNLHSIVELVHYALQQGLLSRTPE